MLKGDIADLAVDAAGNLAEGVMTEAMEEVGFKQYTLVNPAGYLPVTPATEDFSKAAVKAAKGKEEFYKKFGFVERPSEKYGCGMCQCVENKIEN